MAILLPMGMVGSEKTKLNRISGRHYKDPSEDLENFQKWLSKNPNPVSRVAEFLRELGFHTVNETTMNENIEKEINRQEKSTIKEKESESTEEESTIKKEELESTEEESTIKKEESESTEEESTIKKEELESTEEESTVEKEGIPKYREAILKGACVSNTYENMAKNLMNCWKKYNMYKDSQVRYFLAQCLAEVGGDDDLIENGGDSYLSEYAENGISYCGAGYLQLTGGPNYINFTHKRLNEELPSDYPEPSSAKGAGEARKNIIREWKEKAIDVKGYSEEKFYRIAAIYLIGPFIVAKEYPWEAACYFWEKREIRNYIDGLEMTLGDDFASTFAEDLSFIRMKISVEKSGNKETYYCRRTIQERDSNGKLTDINYTRCKKIEWNDNHTELIIMGEMAWDEVHAEKGKELYEITQALYRVSYMINSGDMVNSGDEFDKIIIPKGLVKRKQALDKFKDYRITYSSWSEDAFDYLKK